MPGATRHHADETLEPADYGIIEDEIDIGGFVGKVTVVRHAGESGILLVLAIRTSPPRRVTRCPS